MIVDAIDALGGLRTALEAPEAQRPETFRQRMMEPLRPFWEGFLAYAPEEARAAARDQDNAAESALATARAFGFYSPELDVAAGLRALDVLGQAGTWPACLAALDDAIRALAPQEHGIDLQRVTATVALANPQLMGGRAGDYTGFGGRPGYVMVLAWPNAFNVPRLPAAMAHEFHHNVRLSFEPWTAGTTVGQYIVLEGLAEAFAAELLGDDKVGPWATALTDAQVEAVRPRFREAVDLADDIRGYMFGDWAAAQHNYTPRGLPDFAGYTVGYQLVRAYLRRTDHSAAETTYVPWREIVEESGYL